VTTMHIPRVWLGLLEPGQPLFTQIQNYHGLPEKETGGLAAEIAESYKQTLRKFSASHGENTPCFLVRVPDHVALEGGGNEADGGVACFEVLLCVSPRNDSRVTLNFTDGSFAPAQFDLFEGMPDKRVIAWSDFAKKYGDKPADSVRAALQFYLNSHTGPTGRIELDVPGLNIFCGSLPPAGCEGPSGTSLIVASLLAMYAITGESASISPDDFADVCISADETCPGRKGVVEMVLRGKEAPVAHVCGGQLLHAGPCRGAVVVES
jgi:hypothetical protein